MRARMALTLAGIEVEIREISLRDKPEHMLQISPKGTVPVLVLPNGKVIDESLAIMYWALQQYDPQALLDEDVVKMSELIAENDGSFKQALDCYKYPERNFQYKHEKTQLQYRQQGEVFLLQLEKFLEQNTYLLKSTPSLADLAIFPFVRQFAEVDSAWFGRTPYPKLLIWLNGWINSELFKIVMTKNPTFVG